MSESVTNAKNILIYNRKLNDDVRNGHAKPTEAKRQVSSWHIINKKSAPRSNKYFVTWRPDLRDEQEQNKEILDIILAKHQQERVQFNPQFYFHHDTKSTQTSQPFLTSAFNSVSPPPSTSTPAPTTPSWTYKPVFNTIFSAASNTPEDRPSFQPTTVRPNVSTTTTTKTTTTMTTSSTITTARTSDSPLDQTLTGEISKPFQSNLPLEDEETILQSPASFIAYLRYVLSIFLRSEPQFRSLTYTIYILHSITKVCR